MSNVCVLTPSVGGKKSVLYEGILKATANDRVLTNFLYAISKQTPIKNSFESKEFNSQGEVKPRVFIDKFKVSELVHSKQDLVKERQEIGAEDHNGRPISYDFPEDIYQKVIDYNNNHFAYKANIKFSDGKFYIELNGLNATNYEINRSLESRKARFDATNKFLSAYGFNTDFSDAVRVSTANLLNAVGYIKTIKDIIDTSSKGGYKYTPQTAALLQDLMNKDPLMKRIESFFGEDTADVISFISGRDATVLSEEAASKLDDYWINKVKALLMTSRNKLSQLDLVALTADITRADKQIQDKAPEYFGVASTEISHTLRDLYDTYHLDKETMNSINDSINTLSEAANRFMRIRLKELELQRAKIGNKRGDDNVLKSIQKDITHGKYAQSIVSFLESVSNNIQAQIDNTKAIAEQFEASPDALDAINRLSASILHILESVEAHKDIIEKLTNADQLEVDQMNVPEELIQQIKVAARGLNQALLDARSYARDKQFDVVYAFMKLYWGDSDIQEFNGESHSLENILRIAQKDVNVFDRFIYSMNESNDEALGLIYEAVKTRDRARNELLQKGHFIVRTLTEDLYKSSDSDFMFSRDEKHVPTGMLISNVDYAKFKADKEAYKAALQKEGLNKRDIESKTDDWIRANTKTMKPFTNTVFSNAITQYVKTLYGETANPEDFSFEVTVPNPEKYSSNDLNGLSTAQREYYYKMMALKMVLSYQTPNAGMSFFNAIQVSADFTTALKEAGGDPTRVLQMVKNKITDVFQHREDDTEYGESLDDVLETNGMKRALSDINGHELMKLPLFFSHDIKDKTRLSTDFSRGMLAMMTAALQYNEMNKVIDALMLSKDWLLSKRSTQKTAGDKVLTDIFTWGRDMYMNSVTNDIGSSRSAGLLTDFMDTAAFGRTKKSEGTISLFGYKISKDKAADLMTGYSSITGLTTNLLGAQANLLVGKLQMIIEGSAGEFFDLKDLAVGEFEYFEMIPQLLLELNSNYKSSKLGLLMEKFDVLGDYYGKLKEAGFYKSAFGKIVGNTNLFFMYGIGEHYLHAVTMLAVLHRNKVHDIQTNRDISMLDAYEVSKTGSSGLLTINRDRYKWIETDAEGNTTYRDITDKDEELVDKKITYSNKSMHGAFNSLDKGMAHRYAIGRLMMNFKQWMPGHYQRRFRSLHRDADLGVYRRGYYTTLFSFLADTVTDLKDRKFQIATRWEEMSEMDKYNMKRIVAELTIFALLTASNISLGKYKDKRGNWAYRNLMYQVKRMLMETQASSPIIMPFSGYGAMGFVKSIITTLNSPIASLSAIDKLTNILDFSNIFSEVQNGKNKGDNLYIHNLSRNLPFYGQINKQFNLDQDDYVFNVFTKSGQKQ